MLYLGIPARNSDMKGWFNPVITMIKSKDLKDAIILYARSGGSLCMKQNSR